MACEEELLAGNLQVEASPGRAGDAAKQGAQKLLGHLKCYAFSPMDLHNDFPNLLRVSAFSSTQSTAYMLPQPLSSCKSLTAILHTWMLKGPCVASCFRVKSIPGVTSHPANCCSYVLQQ